MNKYKYIIIGVIVIFLLSLYFLCIRKTEDKDFEKETTTTEQEAYQYSRVNFFLDKKYKASINIPEYWEGNYRRHDSANNVDFIYLDKGIESTKLFSIKMLPKEETVRGNVDNLLFENDKYYYEYNLPEEKINNELYKKMKNDIELIIKSFKVS